jgi:hypothetical protein
MKLHRDGEKRKCWFWISMTPLEQVPYTLYPPLKHSHISSFGVKTTWKGPSFGKSTACPFGCSSFIGTSLHHTHYHSAQKCYQIIIQRLIYMWGSHGSWLWKLALLGHDAVYSSTHLPIFWKKVLPPSPEQRSHSSKMLASIYQTA